MEDEKPEIEIGIVIVLIIVGLSIVPVAFSNASDYFSNYLSTYYPTALAILRDVAGWLVGISIPVSVLLLIGIVVAIEGTKHVRRKEAETYDLKVELAEDTAAPKGDPALTRKWQTVMSHADSPNPSDWRQAIIEADIILGEILTKMQYPGDGIGEQLKAATKADFNTLDQAWEAHRIRNQIAHEGSDFPLSQYEAKRVVNLFRQVFEEFFYI
jgi:hypothetical protein